MFLATHREQLKPRTSELEQRLRFNARLEAGSALAWTAGLLTAHNQTATLLQDPRVDADKYRAREPLIRGRQGRALFFRIMLGRAVRSPGLFQGRMCPDDRSFSFSSHPPPPASPRALSAKADSS